MQLFKLIISTAVFAILFHAIAKAQTPIVMDPALTAAIIAGNATENNKMSSIENLKDKINKTQIATTVVLGEIDKVQNKIYNGLSKVSSAVSDLYKIKYCYNSLQNIIKYEAMMLQEAKKNPIALGWAYKNQKYMYERALLAYSNIAGYILKSGNQALMDAGQRTQLIYNIHSELQVIEAYAIGSYFAVKRVVQVGVIQSLNPFKGYIDTDRRAVQDILRRVKF